MEQFVILMRLSYLYLFLFVLCFYSCNRNQSPKHPITENNQEAVSSDTLPLGIQFRLKCEQMEKDSLLPGLKSYSYEVPCCDTCIYSLTVDIKMQYPEMPDNSFKSYKNNNGLRRFYSCQLCDWVESTTGKKPNVYIPKTFTWSADSLAHYYSIKLREIAGKQLKRDHQVTDSHYQHGIAGYSSISMFEVFRNEKYATICVYEYYGLSGMYHYYYKYSYYTVDINDGGAVYLGFNRIFKKKSANSVLELLAKGLVEARFGIGKQVEDYHGDFSELKTDQVALVPEGVLFYYAPYEQGSFSEGQINVILPYDSIVDFVNPDILEIVGQTKYTIQ